MAINFLQDDDPYQQVYQPPAYSDPGAYAPAQTPRSPEDLLAAAQRSAQGYNQTTTQTPNPTANNWGYLGGGVDYNKLNDPNHKTPKYEVQRYLAQFDPKALGQQGLLNLSEQAKQYLSGLGYQIKDEDKIFRQDIGEIDVLHGDRSEYGWRLTGVGNVAPAGKAKKPTTFVDSGHGNDVYPPGHPLYKAPAGAKPGVPGVPAPGSQFSDPLTKQYEAMLQQQTALYQQQQQAMQAEALQKQGVRAQTDAAVKQLLEFVQQRIGKLQQPAYTGSEAEVLRSQLLDPLERDRQATQKRALDNVGSRGFDPSSGIAQDLFRQVDRGYDEQRTTAQRDIAYKQINEQRSREQEAQELLKYAAGVPDAAARGDLSFLSYLDSLVNQPGQQGLATSAMLADLPVQRAQLGMQALGLGGQPQSGVNGALSLLQNAQSQRLMQQQQQSDFWKSIGLSFT
jgi:hypothetical protein